MTSTLKTLCCALVLVLAGACAGTRAATPPAATPPPNLTQADAQQLLGVLNDPRQRAELVTTLTNLSKTLHQPAPAPAAVSFKPDSLGADVLASAGEVGSALGRQASDLQRAMRDFRTLGPWLNSIIEDPPRRDEVLGALWRLAVVLATALLTVWAITRQLTRPIAIIGRWSAGMARTDHSAPEAAISDPGAPFEPAIEAGPEEEVALHKHNRSFRRLLYSLARLPFALAHLLLQLLPIVGFSLVAFAFETAGFPANPESRLVVSTALRCFIVAGVLIAIVLTLFSPRTASLRLILVSDKAATRVAFWLRSMLLVGAWGFSSITVMQTLGLSSFASLALAKALMLVEHTLLAGLTLQSRRDVERRLRPRRRLHGVLRRIVASLARWWWVYAIVLNYAFWVIWALQIRNGFTQLWFLSLRTVLVIVAMRLLSIAVLGGLARFMRADTGKGRARWVSARARRYYPILRRLATLGMFALSLLVLLEVWGVNSVGWFKNGALGGRLFSAVTGILASLAVGVLIWEAANMAMDRHVERLEHETGAAGARVARVRTLLPILRITLSIFLITIIVLTVLSQIGVNIAPLLGGAGIIGVAIGFGSQKLVQDFITGIFLLLENTMQVGDTVTAGGLSGVVEHLSIRTIRLRAGDGSVHIIPFSSVTTVTNTNRGLGNAAVSVDIDPTEDTDRAAETLKQVAMGMRDDPDYKDGMLTDLQFWGVDKVTSQAVTLVGQIGCTDKARYGVQREFNRRMRIAFADAGIRLAVPSSAVTMIPGTKASAPHRPTGDHAPDASDAAGTMIESPPTSALGHAQ
jgi:small-conductance mechanosensitive channel